MTRTLTALYDTYEDAVATVRDLEAAGIGHEQISLIANQAERPARQGSEAGTGAEAGAAFGAVAGGATGLLAGLGMLAIPGIGPVVAAGWLVAVAAGAAGGAVIGGAAGGIIGAMIRSGIPEEDAHVYAESIRRGGSLVTVRVADGDVPRVEAILHKTAPVDPQARGQAYREAGWTGFDENAPGYTEVEIRRERRYHTAPPPR